MRDDPVVTALVTLKLRFPAFDIKDWNDVAQAIAKGEAA